MKMKKKTFASFCAGVVSIVKSLAIVRMKFKNKAENLARAKARSENSFAARKTQTSGQLVITSIHHSA